MEIQISYYSNSTGMAESFMVQGWEAAKQKSAQIIENDITLCETKTSGKILAELTSDKWRDAVRLFNKSNYRKNNIRYYSKNPYKEL